MSSILPQLPASPTRSDSLSLKESPVDDIEGQQQKEEPTTKTRRGAVDVFLGRNKEILQQDEIVWSQGWTPFSQSVSHRMRGVLTKRFFACILLGQLLSFALTSTSVITTELGNNGWAIPCTQSLFFYFSLNLLYTPYTIYRYGFRAWSRMLLHDSWRYLLLAAVDVEANFLVIKAYGYTDLLSCMMLNAWSTPACMIFAFFLVRARYHWSQVLGALICITGLALIVVSDWKTDKNYPANNRVLGDILMLIGATGYGLSNSLEERFVRERPLYEVVGQIGFWGMLINATQGAAVEHDLYLTASWSARNIGLLMAYTCAMLFLYSFAPILFRLSSSPFYNLNILTSNFLGLLFGLGLYHYRPYFLYFIAFPIIIIGLLVYFLVAKPEGTDMNVVSRGKQQAKEELAGTKKVVGERI